ncbi:MAG: pseudouridine synthase [bacterium]
MEPIRLQKYLAEKGYASRRGAEKLIADGFVKVNGILITEMGIKVTPGQDTVEVNAKAISKINASKTVIMLNKPLGFVTTKSPDEGRNVMELIAKHPLASQMNPVGRLDKDSSGILLFTNDGLLQYAIVNPETHLEKEYEVTTEEDHTPSQLEKMTEGVMLDDSKTRPAPVKVTGPNKFNICLTEGRNRQVRRMCKKVGLTLIELRRVRINTLVLGDLRGGCWRELSLEEINALREAVKP